LDVGLWKKSIENRKETKESRDWDSEYRKLELELVPIAIGIELELE
jgi:hypothetical protein